MDLPNDTKLIILDRDGVINYDSDNYIKSAEEWIPISGSLEAIATLNKAAYKVAIATNQSGIGRGYYDLTRLEEMHKKMHTLLANVDGKIDHISFCPHIPDDNCRCRKPKAGMLLEISKKFSIKPEKVFFVGDTITDKQAAEAANMSFILVKTGKGEKTLTNLTEAERESMTVFDSLQQWVEQL